MKRGLVAMIGLLCFLGANAGEAIVTDSVLTIPGGTTKVDARQFMDRTDFHTVRFAMPCKMAEIGEHAFMGCRNLRHIELPSTLTKIGEGAFRECESLAEIEIPRGVVALPRQAFAWCVGLRRVSIPAVKDIGSHAFAYCENLDSLKFAKNLDHVGSNAFSFCKSLREVELPPSVTELESYAFAECESLRRATLPGNNRLLGELIFCGCRNLEEIRINSPRPPEFDCNSTLFDPEEGYMYTRCVLCVPRTAVEAYRKAPGWKLFERIK